MYGSKLCTMQIFNCNFMHFHSELLSATQIQRWRRGEAFKGMGQVTSDHSLRVSEQLGGEVCLEELFWKLEDNGSMIVQELWKGVGGQACVNGRETSSEAMRPEPISAPS